MVKVKKSIVEKVKAINESKVLQKELRLAAIAVPLADLEDENACLEILTGLQEEASTIEDPTAWVTEAAKTILEEWKQQQEDVEVEDGGEWTEAYPIPAPPPPVSAPAGGAAKGGGKQGDWRPGDWECTECGNHNFARNTVCKKCGAARPDGTTAASPAPSKGKGKGTSGPIRPGDWMCPSCGNHVYASKSVCGSCGSVKTGVVFTAQAASDGAGGGGGGGGGAAAPASAPPANAKPGDWSCPSCGDHNFARNKVCRSCGADKPEGAGMAGNAGKGGAGKGDKKGMKPGDWECPACGEHNFARNETCRACEHQRPANVAPAPGKGRQQEWKPGDWECTACGSHQFARNMTCRNCGADRPDEEASGPPKKRAKA